ncbi:MAG TPA: hypothetical protein VHZ03_55780 [Trebonia sp.]|nr:hypothetical protein [Trebonia sp.]
MIPCQALLARLPASEARCVVSFQVLTPTAPKSVAIPQLRHSHRQ